MPVGRRTAYESRDASGLNLMMRLQSSLPRALAVTFFVLTYGFLNSRTRSGPQAPFASIE